LTVAPPTCESIVRVGVRLIGSLIHARSLLIIGLGVEKSAFNIGTVIN